MYAKATTSKSSRNQRCEILITSFRSEADRGAIERPGVRVRVRVGVGVRVGERGRDGIGRGVRVGVRVRVGLKSKIGSEEWVRTRRRKTEKK